jgi:uncharacterized protein (DUF2141 family)
MKLPSIAAVAAAFLLGSLFTPNTSTAAGPGLALRINGLRSDDGQVLVVVYRGEDGFPQKPDLAWKKLAVKVSGGRASVNLGDVPPGEYAVAVVHDENSNNQLDTSWIGIPQEGIGASNNARGRMGPPKYRDARFEVGADGTTQNITMMYL